MIPQLRMPMESPGCYLYLWLSGYKSEVPTTPSLYSINLLEKLRETNYKIAGFIVKGYNSVTIRWRRCKR